MGGTMQTVKPCMAGGSPIGGAHLRFKFGQNSEGVEQVVSASALGWGSLYDRDGQARCDQEATAQRKTGYIGYAFHLFWLRKRALTVEAPKSKFRVHFVDAPNARPVSAKRDIDLLDLWRNHEKLLRYLPRRTGGSESGRAGRAEIRCIDGGSWRH